MQTVKLNRKYDNALWVDFFNVTLQYHRGTGFIEFLKTQYKITYNNKTRSITGLGHHLDFLLLILSEYATNY